MYMCVTCIDCVSVYNSSIGFCNCYDSVIFCNCYDSVIFCNCYDSVIFCNCYDSVIFSFILFLCYLVFSTCFYTP